MAQIDELRYRMAINFAAIFKDTSQRSLHLAGAKLREIVTALADDAKNGPMLAKANKHLASLMRAAVVQAYQDNVLAEAVPSYRAGQGRYPGALLAVLQRQNFAVGSREGVGFMPESALGQKNVQFWARLNFGALPAVDSRARPVARVQFGSNQGASFALTSPPRPGFSVPETPAIGGYFNKAGQFHIGFPARGNRKGKILISPKPSEHGIGARRFMDAGLVALANNFGEVYHVEIQEAGRKAAARGKTAKLRG